MAKFCGNIGFVKTIEQTPGIWVNDSVERTYYGDITRNTRNIENSSNVIDNLNISNSISIVSDKYANENFQYMKYVVFMGIKWKIDTVTIEYPRMNITIGGVYNG